jgi:hypothetical protein
MKYNEGFLHYEYLYRGAGPRRFLLYMNLPVTGSIGDKSQLWKNHGRAGNPAKISWGLGDMNTLVHNVGRFTPLLIRDCCGNCPDFFS